jgi:primosomal protein N'
MRDLKVGDRVRVPWGFGDPVEGEIIEIWDDSQAHIRVLIQFEDEDEPFILLLTRSAVEAA